MLLRPEMYIGQIEATAHDMWVFDVELQRMKKKTIKYSPALLKVVSFQLLISTLL